ncbi:hypothetical protein LQZ18_03135 [Lachnospiraceae bacterium ZAX-1]
MINVEAEQLLKDDNKCERKIFPLELETTMADVNKYIYAELEDALIAFKGDGTTEF